MNEDCVRLTSYFRERQRADGRPVADALADLYASREVAASTVLRGTDGSAAAIAVSPRKDIEALLCQVVDLTCPGLVTVEQVRLLTGDIDPVWLGEEPGEATRLTIHLARQDRAYQVPAFEAACELLFRRGIAGATVLPGADGTICGRRRHPRYLRHDADAPLMVIAVGSGDEIGMILPELGTLFRHPVMTVEKVQLRKPDGRLAGHPPVLPAAEPGGLAVRLQLTAYTSAAARHDGRPTYRAIARQLGPAGLENATTVRGIWGFHGDHAPHGGHFPRGGRHVPVVTTVTGTPERISATFDAVGTLTAGRGLVTVHTVLAARPAASAVQRPAASEEATGRWMDDGRPSDDTR